MKFNFSVDGDAVTIQEGDGAAATFPIGSQEAFSAISRAWLRLGWESKYVYGFSWLGRPIIQLPEDIVRIQELIYRVKPNVIVETGVAHGGSLVLYASLLNAMGGGRVIGIDIEIREKNRRAIEAHELSGLITLIEGSSTDGEVVANTTRIINPGDRVMVILDSNHSKSHVLAELRAYSPLVSPGSYIVVCDGIMRQVAGASRTSPDWLDDNPLEAIKEFLAEDGRFAQEEPAFPFNEGSIVERVTYWPGGFLRRLA